MKTEGRFNYRKYSIYHWLENPEARSRTGILFLHGRYAHSAYARLIFGGHTEHKIFGFDYPGQGQSSGSRGNIDVYKVLPALTQAFVSNVIAKSGVENLFIVGESLGSLVAFYSLREFEFPLKIKGLVMVPGVFRLKQMERFWSRFLLFSLSKLLPSFGLKNKKPFSNYTQNRETLDMLETDPFYCRFSSFRYIYGLARLVQYLDAGAEEFQFPLMIFQGRNDAYTDVSVARNFFDRLPEQSENRFMIMEDSQHWLAVGNDVAVINRSLFKWIGELES